MELRMQEKSAVQILQLKLVYWGPGESGKTTNFLQLMKKYQKNKISGGFQIATTDKRTLWQDSAFLSFDTIILGKSYEIIIQIATCTGQERFLTTREYVLRGADAVIFVADSKNEKMNQNIRSFKELIAFISGKDVPFLIQLNKRDLSDAISIPEFKERMGLPEENFDDDLHLIVYPTVAINGIEVYSIFHDIVEKILLKMAKNRII